MYQVAKRPSATLDVIAALSSSGLVWLLAWHDVRQRYRRSIIGPFWITISNAVLIGAIGLIFGKLFGASSDFIVSLAIGLTLWMFMSTSIQEGCSSFIEAERVIKQLPVPLIVHVERVVVRNLLIFAHNIVIVPLAMILFGTGWSWLIFLSFVGFCVVLINVLWMALLAAIVCTRYRDLPQIIANALQIIFYVTPIIWPPRLIGDDSALLDFNPFYHLLEIVRAPLLANWPSIGNWTVSLLLAVVGWAIALRFFSNYRQRIAYWL
jgi:lipopolysaccharide transport system permease protein